MKTVSQIRSKFCYGLIWIFFFGVFFSAGTLSQDYLKSQHLDFWTSTASDLTHALPMNDGSSYINYAHWILGDREWSDIYWTVTNWTPAVPAVIALILKFSGEENYFVKMLIFSSLLWASVFTFLISFFSMSISRWKQILILTSLIFLPDFRDWTVGHGSFMSDSGATAFFIVAIAMLGKGILFHKKWLIYLSAAVFGISTLFRGMTNLLVESSFFIWAFLVSLVILGIGCRFFVSSDGSWNISGFKSIFRDPLIKKYIGILIAGFAFLFLFEVASSPWKIFNYQRIGKYTVSPNSEYEYHVHWKTPAEAVEFEFFAHAPIPACVTNPELCAIIKANDQALSPYKKNLSMMVLFSDPGKWLSYKLGGVYWFWMDKPFFENPFLSFTYWLEGFFYLAVLFWLIVSLYRELPKRSGQEKDALVVFSILFFSLIVPNLIFIVMIHFESRYSLPFRLSGLVLSALYLQFRNIKEAR